MKISKRDWAHISAYLDGELSQRELNRFENRIKDNPDFQAALEDLRTVKTVLSQTPPLSVPRNFSLKQSLVESPHRPIPARGYRLAAAALSFLFIGVVVLDFGSRALKGGMLPAQAPRAEEVMLEAAADEMEEPAPLFAVEKSAEGETVPEAEMEEAIEAPESADAFTQKESVGMEEEPGVATEETRAFNNEEDAQVGEGGDLLDEIPPTTVPEIEEAEHVSDQETDWTAELQSIPWLRILEITLGLGAVVFGLAAWMNYRKNRKQ